MRQLATYVVVLLGIVLMPSMAYAMPATDHLAGAELLLSVPAKQGGAAELTEQALHQIQEWMDEPSKWLGSAHGGARHNVDDVVTHFAKQGLDPDAVRNVARLHKIQDIAHNVRPVDGWEITSKMKQQADDLLRYVGKRGRLPKKLPSWVDEPGKLLDDVAKGATKALSRNGDDATKAVSKSADDVSRAAARSAHSADDAIRATAKAGKAASKVSKGAKVVGKVAVPVAIAVEGGVRGVGVYKTEQAYRRGEITNEERCRSHGENAGHMAGGVAGAWAGAKGGALVGGGIGALFGGVGAPIGAAAGGIIGAIGGAIAGDYVGGQAGAAAGRAVAD